MNIQANILTLNTFSNSAVSRGSLSTDTSSQNSAQTSNISDTVTISAQGLALFAESQGANQEALAAAMDEAAKDKSSTLADVLGTDTEDTTEESTEDPSTSSDLSSYTDSQLQSLVAAGSITQAEATAELAKREQNSSENQQTSSTQPASINLQV